MKLGTKRLIAFLSGEKRIQIVNGIPMEYVIEDASGVFKYNGKSLRIKTDDFDWGAKNALQEVCDKINKEFGL